MSPPHTSMSGDDLSSLLLPARHHSNDPEYVHATLLARMQQLSGRSAPELWVHVAEGSARERMLALMTHCVSEPLGWELTIFPTNSRRRRLRLPRGVLLDRNLHSIRESDLSHLDPRVATSILDPRIDPPDSFALYVEDELRGCIPVTRIHPTIVTFPAIVLDGALLSDDPRRRSYFRLAAWSAVCDEHLLEGSTVKAWIPDDGDPISEYKRQVAAADWTTHWVTYRVLPHHLGL